MMDNVDDMEVALDMIEEYLNVDKVIIAVESNKRKAISNMKKLAAKKKNRSVSVLPSIYPQGGEKVLIYHTVGRIVEERCLPIDVGCVVCNCTTIAAIGKYIKTGMPLVEKCITVDGGAIKEPKNVIAPIGASLGDVFEFCGGFSAPPAKVIYGGPMMGIAVPDLNAPVLKNTNAALAFTEKETILPESTQCIHCGSCANQCPFGLNPAVIAKAYRNRDLQKLIAVDANLCMECGCCAYVCPSRIQLVMTNKLAKDYMKQEAAKAKGGN
jgi:electron transport complex protein RnfC